MRSAMQCTMSGRSSRTIRTMRKKPRNASNGPKLRRSFSSRNHTAAFRLDARRLIAHARRHHDLETSRLRGAGHRQEMGDEKPVLGDEIKKFGHQRSADRRDAPL
jgi:hypothetical protein